LALEKVQVEIQGQSEENLWYRRRVIDKIEIGRILRYLINDGESRRSVT